MTAKKIEDLAEVSSVEIAGRYGDKFKNARFELLIKYALEIAFQVTNLTISERAAALRAAADLLERQGAIEAAKAGLS